MCGILLLHGPDAPERLATCLSRLAHRGPDGAAHWSDGQTALGFRRLAINDKGAAGQQPFHHGPLVGAINGEIYNHRALRNRFDLQVEGHCDTRVVLPLFEQLAEGIIDELDGFYSGVVFDRGRGALSCLRAPMGKKPLLAGRSGSEVFVTSELKALGEVQSFQLLPKGVSRVDLQTGEVQFVKAHTAPEPHGDLRALLEQAVEKRIPGDDEPLGLFLSGGLDSSIVAALAVQKRRDINFYTLGGEASPDHQFVMHMVRALGLENLRVVPLPSPEELPALIGAVVRATESYNPSIVSNGLCTYLLARAAHEDGLKVVLTGEGADELYCGYMCHRPADPWRETRRQLIEDMHFTELRRLDTCTMAHAIEARCPFLDRAVRHFADGLDYEGHYRAEQGGLQNKVAIRDACADLLPTDVLHRRKTSFDVGSGVRAQVVEHLRRRGGTERAALQRIWRRSFSFDPAHPYFHAYPAFDAAIDRRGASHR